MDRSADRSVDRSAEGGSVCAGGEFGQDDSCKVALVTLVETRLNIRDTFERDDCRAALLRRNGFWEGWILFLRRWIPGSLASGGLFAPAFCIDCTGCFDFNIR